MRDFARPSLIRDPVGIDSIQGLLEWATWYGKGRSIHLSFSEEESADPNGSIVALRQLESEGYVQFQLSDAENGHVGLELLTLTIAGHRLLAELRRSLRRDGLRDVSENCSG